MVDTKVLIGVPTGEYGRRADFYDYINIMAKNRDDILMFVHDRSPARNRNMIIEQALIHECSHVLFIDDDMAPPADGLQKLLEHGKDIVTGLYLIGTYPHQPLIFDTVGEEGSLFSYLEENAPRLKSIKAAGMGFCLIKTNVFRQMEPPYFRLGELDPEQWCDDIGFFHRADQIGIKAYCDTDCLVGHIKTMIIKPNKVNGKWFTSYDTGGRGAINTPQINPNLVVQS